MFDGSGRAEMCRCAYPKAKTKGKNHTENVLTPLASAGDSSRGSACHTWPLLSPCRTSPCFCRLTPNLSWKGQETKMVFQVSLHFQEWFF